MHSIHSYEIFVPIKEGYWWPKGAIAMLFLTITDASHRAGQYLPLQVLPVLFSRIWLLAEMKINFL